MAFSAGQVPTAGELNELLPLFVYKTADESVTSSTTNQPDDHLILAVAANLTYDLEFLWIYAADSTADIKFGFSAPTGATLDWGCHAQLGGGTGISGSVAFDSQTIGQQAFILGGFGAGNTQNMTARGWGRLVVSSTAGNLSVNWSQNASSATSSIMRAGSKMTLRKVA